MKNTISITKNCICSCVDNVADDTNTIVIAVEVGNVENPILKVWLNDTLQSTTELITNEINYIVIDDTLFNNSGAITFQYLDDGYTCKVFTINLPGTADGNLSVKKTSDYVFTAKYTKSGGTVGEITPATTSKLGGVIVGNGLNVENNGLLSVDDSFFISVSNGKSLIASAITDKGIETASDATFKTMADNIEKISSGINYTSINHIYAVKDYSEVS